MKRNEIRVSHLEIRLRNGDLSRARDLRTTIGGELLRQIAAQTDTPLKAGSVKIDHIDAGKLSLKQSSRVESGNAIARHVATAIRPKLTQFRSGKR